MTTCWTIIWAHSGWDNCCWSGLHPYPIVVLVCSKVDIQQLLNGNASMPFPPTYGRDKQIRPISSMQPCPESRRESLQL
eukprot:5417243-Karenia_brevis.AAC.1